MNSHGQKTASMDQIKSKDQARYAGATQSWQFIWSMLNLKVPMAEERRSPPPAQEL